eukprot:747705-Hanusia_phi.AAC.6
MFALEASRSATQIIPPLLNTLYEIAHHNTHSQHTLHLHIKLLPAVGASRAATANAGIRHPQRFAFCNCPRRATGKQCQNSRREATTKHNGRWEC